MSAQTCLVGMSVLDHCLLHRTGCSVAVVPHVPPTSVGHGGGETIDDLLGELFGEVVLGRLGLLMSFTTQWERSMDKNTRTNLDNLHSEDGDTRFKAMNTILKLTEDRVDWAYEVWDDLLEHLRHANNHQRAIAAQVLCNLAKSDTENRMARDFAALLAVTKDERFVTARHCLQSLWKVGAAGKKLQKIVVDGLAGRFNECASEKNCTLIRYDIIQGLKRLYDAVKDETVREKAMQLIGTETDDKYREKYASVWRVKRSSNG